MSYAQSVLQPGENVVAMGRLHWTLYWPAIFFLLAGTATVWWLHAKWPAYEKVIATTAVTFGALFLITFLRAWFIRWITEFAVTNKRVIFKRGFINRRTVEMNMDKVESVDVDQSVPGRLLGYGRIQVKGTGEGEGIVVDRIGSPIVLRNAITAK
jgi:uncharacterized membrane protein YdbT with pleckstrin-like domain